MDRVGQHVDHQDPCAARSHQARAGNIVDLPLRRESGSHHTGVAGYKDDSQRYDHVMLTRSQNTDDDQGKKNAGEGRQRVVKAHQHFICNSAKISRDRANDRSDTGADQDRKRRDHKSRSGSLHDTAENIAPELIRSKQMRKGRPLQLCGAHFGRRIGCVKTPDQDPHHNDGCYDRSRDQISVPFTFFHARPPSFRRGSIF